MGLLYDDHIKKIIIHGWLRQNYDDDNIPHDLIKLIELMLKRHDFIHWLLADEVQFAEIFKIQTAKRNGILHYCHQIHSQLITLNFIYILNLKMAKISNIG